MKTECSQLAFDFQPLGARQVVADFEGGTITSDAGGLLLREVEARTGLLAKLARCFDDYRDEELIEHSVTDLIKQRVFALALGYEDLNDHDQLRADPLRATRRRQSRASREGEQPAVRRHEFVRRTVRDPRVV